jgi:PAS domain S-box-containing protein
MEPELNFNEAQPHEEILDPVLLCRYLSERSPLPLIVAEGSTHLVRYVNPAFCRLTRAQGEDLIGKPFVLVVPESDENGSLAVLDSVYRTGESEILADQKHRWPTSEPNYWSYAVWAILDAKERPAGVMIQVTDTTQQTLARQQLGLFSQTLLLSGLHQHRLAEEAETGIQRLHRFMRETDHRAKNNLQLVVALLDMQILENPEVVSVTVLVQLRLHIQTVASFHDLLTHFVQVGPQENAVSATAILTKLLPIWQRIVGTQGFHWRSDKVILSIKKGLSVALIINELVTNAVKHGGKEVELRLTQQENLATLSVSDDGTGFAPDFDPVTSANFGLEFIESVVRLELRGQVAYANNSGGGACITVTFSISE